MTAVRAVPAGFPKGRLVLYALVPGLLLVDIVNGMVGGASAMAGLPSPAELVRGAIFLWSLVVLLRVVHPALRPLQGWTLVLAALGAIGLMLTYLASGNVHDLIFDVSQLSKALYGPAVVLLLAVLIRRYRLGPPEVLDAVAWIAGLAGGSIVFLAVTGIGQATYRAYQLGSKGLFISQNDIGVAMGIGLTAALYMMLQTRRMRYAMLSFFGMAGMLLLGTRAALLGAFVISITMLVLLRSSIVPGRRHAFKGVVVASGIVVVLAVMGSWEYRNIQATRFQQVKLQRLAENPFVRGIRVIAAIDYASGRPPIEAAFGEGTITYGRGVARSMGVQTDHALAEVDWMDMFGAYGVLFVLLIYAYYAAFIRQARRLARKYDQALYHTVVLAIVWFLFHSVVAGHALAGTIPNGALAPILSMIWVESQTSLRPAEVTGA